MPMIRPTTLSTEQYVTLETYITEHGATWKDDLAAEWVAETVGPVLAGLRTTRGLAWLANYTPPQRVDEPIRPITE